MPGELSSLEFALSDTVGGQPLTPETVDLPTLRGFLAEVEKLIKGDVPGVTLSDSRVRIEEGSIRLITMVAAVIATSVRADLTRLEETGDLDQIQPRRAEVIELWQRRAIMSPSRSYALKPNVDLPAWHVTQKSQLQHGGENSWVAVEKYLTGKVVNAGGKKEPNVHLILADTGVSVMVNATEQQLGAEKENQLYKVLTLWVRAEQHLRTHELRNVRLIQFLPQSAVADERALENLWKNGREAWRDIPSASDWVEALRGNG